MPQTRKWLRANWASFGLLNPARSEKSVDSEMSEPREKISDELLARTLSQRLATWANSVDLGTVS
jgi:hypothetical protein